MLETVKYHPYRPAAFGLTLYLRASKSTSENTITFGQESDYTGPLGNTMKVVAQRNGDVITANAMGVDIKLELVGGKAVETFTDGTIAFGQL